MEPTNDTNYLVFRKLPAVHGLLYGFVEGGNGLHQ